MMLARAVGRSLRLTALGKPSAACRTTSAQWARSLASNSRRGPPRKPADYSKPTGASLPSRPSSIGPQRSTGATTPFDSPDSKNVPTINDQVDELHSKRHDDMNGKSSLDHINALSSKIAGSGASESEVNTGGPEFSGLHDEVRSRTSPSEDLASESKAPSDKGGPEILQPIRSLPDLTQGIPSTLEYETMGNTSAGRAKGTSLNLTEDPLQGSGGRGKGELPASAYISSSEKKRLRVANYLYATFAATCLLGYIYLGRNWESEDEEREHPDAPSGWALGLMWNRVKARAKDQMNYYNEPAFKKLLPDQSADPAMYRPYTLVLSLEDMLVHSEWSREHGWRMAKRPGVDYFLRYLNQYYELVIFTSVPWTMAEPVIKKLDPYRIVTWPLFREATVYKNGEYIKDLSYLNRDLSKVIMIDTVPSHAKAQPENAIILKKWEGDPQDKELVSFIPFLEYIAAMNYGDVRQALKSFEGTYIPIEFAAREAIARKKFEAEMEEERKRRPKSNLGLLSNALGLKQGPMYEGEQTAAEAFAQGKTLLDQARERGQRNYEHLEKMIQEQGDLWLKEEAANEELAKQEGMKAMKSGLTGFFGVPNSKPDAE